MENSLKGLLLAGGVIITLVVVSLGFLISREAQDVSAGAVGQINKLNAEFSDSDKTIYDGLKVSGKEVVSVVNKFKDDEVKVTIYTKSNTSGITKPSSAKSDKDYVNPTAYFIGEVVRNENSAIVEIKFTQQ